MILADLRFDRYYRYDEFVGFLHAFVREHPHLVSIEVIGRSYQGRDIHVLTFTNTATGPASEKPAFWVDANIHSIELASGAAALYFMRSLVDGYGKDADITRALDERTFYVCPRPNPDGVEFALADSPRFVRSSVRPYPFDEDAVDGLDVQDVDGDGRILTMRVRDANGAWKTHPTDPRLMVRRDPTEHGGEYWRLLPEGRVREFDGIKFGVNPPKEGLDLNRNYPAGWRQEFEQVGSGDFPTSEPEIRAVVEFVNAHRNLGGGTSLHTFSGVLLRPFSMYSDDDMAPEDLWVYKTIGAKGTEITGYPNISTYHEFRYHPKQVISGTEDWFFDHLGLYLWVIEIWSPMREAGIEKYDYIHWFRDHPAEDDVKLLQWNEAKLRGEGYVAWKPFDHPDLGPVEIGGWDRLNAITNPPSHLLENEIAKFPGWLVWQSLVLPRLTLRETRIESLGGDAWRVRVAVQNTGWLPTSVSQRAVDRKVVRGVIAEVALPEGCHLSGGKTRIDLGQLSGWSRKHAAISFWSDTEPLADIGVAEWIVQGSRGASVEVTLRAERAGIVRVSVTLA